MLFNSLTFILFFVFFLVLHYLPFSWRVKKFNLLVGSYIFYAAWNPPFVILLWISTLIDWFAAKAMARATTKPGRRLFLILSLSSNLGMLAFFKYGDFLLDNFVLAMGSLGVEFVPVKFDILLPVGISFYTFQTLSYTIDVYRGELKPWPSFLDFALFVTFFPQLVAGPIMRAVEFLPQFLEPKKAHAQQFFWGLFLLTLGLFEKVVLADGMLGPVSDDIFDWQAPLHPLDAWMGVLAFSGQIFCDFAGYSTCAIGVAHCFGFSLTSNFLFPYAAIGFSDFWRRWHVSLSRWLRDYLYISLGGNRRGRVMTYVNLMLTMLIGGLWHGAAWTFVVWGALHGTYLVVERFLRNRLGHLNWLGTLHMQIFFALVTYFFVNIAWVFFRAPDFGKAGLMIGSMFGLIPVKLEILSTVSILKVTLVTIGILTTHWLMRRTTLEYAMERWPSWLLGAAWGLMLVAVILMQGGGDAFIYFQF